MTIPNPTVLNVGYGQMEVHHMAKGRKLLVLPGGARKPGFQTWYELTPEQAAWLAAELVK